MLGLNLLSEQKEQFVHKTSADNPLTLERFDLLVSYLESHLVDQLDEEQKVDF